MDPIQELYKTNTLNKITISLKRCSEIKYSIRNDSKQLEELTTVK